MMPNISQFTLTKHAVERLFDRSYEFRRLIPRGSNLSEITQIAYGFIQNAVENKSYINNTAFTSRLYKRHGYDKSFSFFTIEDILLIGVSDKGSMVIVTITIRDKHSAAQLRCKKKHWEKKPRNKEECVRNEIAAWPKGHGTFGGLGKGG